MTKLMRSVLCITIVILALNYPASAQDPCSEKDPGCRLITSAESKALKERFLALKAALPIPDQARYALASGVDETYTMPFVAETNIGGGGLICLSWQAGCFIEKNDVSFPYDLKPELKKTVKKPENSKDSEDIDKNLKDMLAWVEGMQAEVGSRIEVSAWLLPHPYLVENRNGKCVDVSDPEAVNIEKSAAFLSWESVEGTNLTMVFGLRTCKEAETLKVEKVATKLAPVVSIEIKISGPEAEVAELKKRVNRKAFEVLLGPVMK